jgi:alpha-tubulin suppressor-like RCC1 family protein
VTVLQPWSDESLTEFSVPDGFPSWQVYEKSLYPSCVLFGINYTNWETLVEEGYTQFSVPMVVTHAWLMDVGSRDTYWTNFEADCEAAEAASMSGGFFAMDENDGGDPCSLTNLLQPFYVTAISQSTNHFTTITWQSCQIFRYLIFSANSLSTNTQWVPQAYVWGATNASATSWTDTATTNDDGSTVTDRFYRVQRLLGSPIAAGGESSVALRQNGTLWAWGGNDGELGDGLDSSMQRADHGLVEPYLPYPSDVADAATCGIQTITNAAVLAAGGDDFTVVVDATGTVWTCGEDSYGELGNGTDGVGLDTPSPIAGVSNIVSVAAGFYHALALRADATVWAWGSDALADGTDVGALGAGFLFSTEADSPIESLVPTGTNIVAIACGDYHSLALDASGNVWGFGDNEFGQIGAGAPTGLDNGTNIPIQVPGISNVIAIAAGDEHSIALTADKRVWTWGSDSSGQLGRNANQSGTNPTPGLVTALTNQYVVAIAGGVGFTLAVTSNGQVYAFGDNTFGELGTNTSAVASTNSPMLVTGISNVVWVSAGRSDDDLGGVYTTNSNYAGGVHTLVMTLDQGTNHYWGFGDNTYGQVGNVTNGGGTIQISQYTPAGPLQFCTRSQREVQLGTAGSFTAQCNGTLYLYFNTDNFNYGFPDDSYTAMVNGSNVTVLATNYQGVAIGTVTIGNVYTFSASGYCAYDYEGDLADPDGRNSISNNFVACTSDNLNVTNSICPLDQCFSLVGKIQ